MFTITIAFQPSGFLTPSDFRQRLVIHICDRFQTRILWQFFTLLDFEILWLVVWRQSIGGWGRQVYLVGVRTLHRCHANDPAMEMMISVSKLGLAATSLTDSSLSPADLLKKQQVSITIKFWLIQDLWFCEFRQLIYMFEKFITS